MSAGPARLLVVAPHATRTGSTRVLIDLLTALRGRLGREVAVEVASGGALLEELEVFGGPLRVGETPVAALFNSVLSLGAGPELAPSVPVIVFVHESTEVLETLSPEAAAALRSASVVLCLSDVHRAEVVAFGVDIDRTELLPPIVTVGSTPPRDEALAPVRAQLGLQPGERLVLGCGEASWRKGTDLFLETVGRLRSLDGVRFAWAGRRLRSVRGILDHDTEALGVDDRLTWLGDVPTVEPYLAVSSLLLMPSRTDPQPLVPLEAAALGVPTVGFHIGGLVELAADGGAATVAYPDTTALADAARAILDDPERSASLAQAADHRRRTRQTPELVATRFLEILDGVIDQDAPMPTPPSASPQDQP